MNILCAHVKEERFVFMRQDEVFGFVGDVVRNIFIIP
ncbi:hypothetical protein EVA_01799 [gut metagenome]|uniref:Uncharacterized protein n=1 Tax=gut metagenome TaxID=749906 RepID=J9H2K8_9ZZZZ